MNIAKDGNSTASVNSSKVSPEPSRLKAEKNKFSEPLPIHHVIQSLTTGLVPVCTCLSCIGEPRSGHSTADMASQGLNRVEESFPWTLLATLVLVLPALVQHALVLPCHKSMLLTYVQLVRWDPRPSAKLHSIQLTPSLYSCMWLFHYRYRI